MFYVAKMMDYKKYLYQLKKISFSLLPVMFPKK